VTINDDPTRANRADRAHLLAKITSDLTIRHGEDKAADSILDHTRELFADTKHASITVRHRRSHHTLASISELASEADRLQYALNEGPCLSAADHSEWYRSGNVGNDDRWPTWGPAARRLGVGSLLSVPLTVRRESIGALNLYSDRLGAFDDKDEIDLALLYAVHAASALVSARHVTQLETAVSSRHDIGIAQGILMNRYNVDQQPAWATLVRVSSQTNTKLRDVAAEVVRTGALPK